MMTWEFNLYKIGVNWEKNICLGCIPMPRGIWSFKCDFCIDTYLHCDVCGEVVDNVVESITFKLHKDDWNHYLHNELNTKFSLKLLKKK